MSEKPSRLHRLLDATSQWFNVLMFNGDPNHSISGDAYRFQRKKTERFIDWLFSFYEDNHCLKAHLHDLDKARRLVDECGKKV